MTEMVTCTVNGEYEIVLPKHRAERPEWYRPEGWEKARMTTLTTIIRHKRQFLLTPEGSAGYSPVVYYVGAEEGDLAAICAMAGAEMYLFEPNPQAWPNIRAIWEANDLPTPVCWPGFASNVQKQNGHAVLRDEWPSHAYAEVVGDHGFKELWSQADDFPQIRLDSFVTEMSLRNGWRPPDIITFDVEGAEWRVLEGAEQILSDYRPTLFASIHPEFMFDHYKEYSADLRRWIKDFGYHEVILDYQHELHTMYVPL